ncbi:11599_t:CDS:2, partial [Funneliformis caledonium]
MNLWIPPVTSVPLLRNLKRTIESNKILPRRLCYFSVEFIFNDPLFETDQVP